MNPYTLMCALWIFYAYVYVYIYIYIVYRSEPIIYTPWASRLTRERNSTLGGGGRIDRRECVCARVT